MDPASREKPPAYGSPPQYPIESVDNALRLLLLFGQQPRIRLTDASAYLGVASSTAHRLLAMLQYRGFVRQDSVSRAYEPGPGLSLLVSATLRQLDIRGRVHPVLERLSAELNETVHFGRLEGQQVHFLDSIESSRTVRVSSRLGRLMAAHCTSTGKAMLSTFGLEELRAIYPGKKLEAVTERSITDRDALERDLEATRRRGYAFSRQESEDGVVSIAVPITSLSGVRYAINVSWPAHRISAGMRDRIAVALRAAAVEVEHMVM